MKLLRYGQVGSEQPGVLDRSGNIRSLSSVINDLGPATLGSVQAKLAGLSIESLPLCPPGTRVGAPIARPGKIVCIGLNYRAHAVEAGMPIPLEPVVFLKASSSLSGPYDPVILPVNSSKCDWEVELGVIIGRKAKRVSPDAALDHVLGYCVVNDVSERAFQLERGGQWTKGKSADTFCPVGPYLVTTDEIANPQALRLRCEVSGRVAQDSSTSDMIFSVADAISYLSFFMTLEPGDLICTGTPQGVGHGHKPPIYLQDGDVMTLSIEGLGEQRQPVVAER
ncbi:FAA hydrolase family protein [Herbaspirillum lusitanum]|uniref:fumarylacetoacetate hydrolase family protein n=1 Tax=Herbaspirillum lusitanum TaxID=213312 RepID=UPI002238BF2C|nr:fumarylacetoacetate hydrolase family protein [Herbaspirillum lusitanum]MCW5297793.1 FAA hydrolase family protein [Herbaspirillum lusitanum]